MHDLIEWVEPQWLTGCLAVALLGSALAIEVGVLLGLLRRPHDPARSDHSRTTLSHHDFYDWLWH
jgi:hypothetical protein